MTKHLFGLIVTPYGVAANNRGENEGNMTTLQKILWKGEVHTTVSAEAIRWAVRYHWQRKGVPVNRMWSEEKSDHDWQDRAWLSWTDPDGAGKGKPLYIDDDVLGFMDTEAASTEGSDDLDEKRRRADELGAGLSAMAPAERRSEKGRGLRQEQKALNDEIRQAGKGKATKRRGALEVTRAISLTPFAGDITFNAKSGKKTSTSLYGTEVHATRYQYAFAITPEALRQRERVLDVVDAFVNLAEVGGNQSRFLYDFSPEAVVFRWTDDFAPRILYGFATDEAGGALTIPNVMKKVETGDLEPGELVAAGPIGLPATGGSDGGLRLHAGVRAAAEEVKARMRADLHI
jgi:CRISPR-associated protein Cst2